ncbi:hypothetical protein GCM10009828_067020 [Actinoplanes couchii]|uniref:Transposase n=2 Tax=Actinoplanes couchii TaxID=403638 RepID=A0ABQ3X2D5_9ACTN|nr:hypothetical protein Aco03nite_010810 [Actinoplanes couchii]
MVADHVPELVEGWRTLSLWEQQGHPGVRRWNGLVDRLNRLAEAAVHDPDQVRAGQPRAVNQRVAIAVWMLKPSSVGP